MYFSSYVEKILLMYKIWSDDITNYVTLWLWRKLWDASDTVDIRKMCGIWGSDGRNEEEYSALEWDAVKFGK
jgi:hypothetical protein